MLNKLIPIYPYDFAICNGSIWFVHPNISALFEYEIGRELKLVTTIPGNKPIYNDVTYFKTVKKENILYFIPFFADSLFSYDTKVNELSLIQYDHSRNIEGKFVDAYVIGENVFCVPLKSNNQMIEISGNDNLVHIVEEWNAPFQERMAYLDYGCRIDENKFCNVISDSCDLVIFDAVNRESHIEHLSCIDGNIHSCACIENYLYVLGDRSGKVSVLDMKMKKVEELCFKYDRARLLTCGKNLLVMSSFHGDGIEIYDVSKNEFTTIYMKKTSNMPAGEYYTGCVAAEGDTNMYFDRRGSELIDLVTGNRYAFFFEEQRLSEIKDNIISYYRNEKQKIIKETNIVGIDEFISLLV